MIDNNGKTNVNMKDLYRKCVRWAVYIIHFRSRVGIFSILDVKYKYLRADIFVHDLWK